MKILRVFVSASRDLLAYRDVVRTELARAGLHVVSQDHFFHSPGSIVELLEHQIEACDAVIQLIGFEAGARPPLSAVRAEDAERSYFEIEGEIALRRRKRVFFFLASDSAVRVSETTSDSLASYRDRIRHAGYLGHTFSSSDELLLLLLRLDFGREAARGRQEVGFRVFISYRRAELISRCVAHRVFEVMSKALGDNHVFLDSHSIPLGTDYREHLYTSISRANFMCAVVGPEWVQTIHDRNGDDRDYVRYEIETAFRLSIPVAPILIEDTEQPKSSSLPDSLARLEVSQGFRLRVGRDLYRDIDELVSRIRALAPQPNEGEQGADGNLH